MHGNRPRAFGMRECDRPCEPSVPWQQNGNKRATMPLIVAVSSMRAQHGQLALVHDEQGRVVGMTSMEDILEQILGEFDDQSDEAATAGRPV